MAIVELEDNMISVPITLGRKRSTPTVQNAVAMGAPTLIHGVRVTAGIRKAMQQLGVSESEFISCARRRAAGGDPLSETPLGKRSIERTVDGEREAGAPVFGGFRNVS